MKNLPEEKTQIKKLIPSRIPLQINSETRNPGHKYSKSNPLEDDEKLSKVKRINQIRLNQLNRVYKVQDKSNSKTSHGPNFQSFNQLESSSKKNVVPVSSKVNTSNKILKEVFEEKGEKVKSQIKKFNKFNKQKKENSDSSLFSQKKNKIEQFKMYDHLDILSLLQKERKGEKELTKDSEYFSPPKKKEKKGEMHRKNVSNSEHALLENSEWNSFINNEYNNDYNSNTKKFSNTTVLSQKILSQINAPSLNSSLKTSKLERNISSANSNYKDNIFIPTYHDQWQSPPTIFFNPMTNIINKFYNNHHRTRPPKSQLKPSSHTHSTNLKHRKTNSLIPSNTIDSEPLTNLPSTHTTPNKNLQNTRTPPTLPGRKNHTHHSTKSPTPHSNSRNTDTPLSNTLHDSNMKTSFSHSPSNVDSLSQLISATNPSIHTNINTNTNNTHDNTSHKPTLSIPSQIFTPPLPIQKPHQYINPTQPQPHRPPHYIHPLQNNHNIQTNNLIPIPNQFTLPFQRHVHSAQTNSRTALLNKNRENEYLSILNNMELLNDYNKQGDLDKSHQLGNSIIKKIHDLENAFVLPDLDAAQKDIQNGGNDGLIQKETQVQDDSHLSDEFGVFKLNESNEKHKRKEEEVGKILLNDEIKKKKGEISNEHSELDYLIDELELTAKSVEESNDGNADESGIQESILFLDEDQEVFGKDCRNEGKNKEKDRNGPYGKVIDQVKPLFYFNIKPLPQGKASTGNSESNTPCFSTLRSHEKIGDKNIRRRESIPLNDSIPFQIANASYFPFTKQLRKKGLSEDFSLSNPKSSGFLYEKAEKDLESEAEPSKFDQFGYLQNFEKLNNTELLNNLHKMNKGHKLSNFVKNKALRATKPSERRNLFENWVERPIINPGALASTFKSTKWEMEGKERKLFGEGEGRVGLNWSDICEKGRIHRIKGKVLTSGGKDKSMLKQSKIKKTAGRNNTTAQEQRVNRILSTTGEKRYLPINDIIFNLSSSSRNNPNSNLTNNKLYSKNYQHFKNKVHFNPSATSVPAAYNHNSNPFYNFNMSFN